MSFQHFSKQEKGKPLQNYRGGRVHLEKEHVVYSGEGIPIYWCPNKKSLSGESVLFPPFCPFCCL
jgi:hypothetical protein